MTSLNEHLLNYIKHEVEMAVTKSAGTSLRLVFSSPPKKYLSSLFDFITKNGSGLQISTAEGQESIPTYLLDNNASDPHQKSLVATCTPTYLTTIRNMDLPIWLVLQEVSASANRSLETTSTPIGIFREVKTFGDWSTTPIVRFLVTRIFEHYGLDENEEKYNNVIEFVLEEMWEVDEGLKEKHSLWDLLSKLAAGRLRNANNEDIFISRIGLPYCSGDEFGSKKHLNILNRFSELLQAKGLRGGFEELEKNADIKKLQSLHEMRAHFELKNVIEANDFAKNPLGVYSPLNDSSVDIPSWWYELDISTWDNLLDSNVIDTPLESVLEVTLMDTLSSTPKGLVPFTASTIRLQTAVTQENRSVAFIIERANGSATFQQIYEGQVSDEEPHEFVDSDIPNHERFIRYRISAEGIKPTVIKVIVLDNFQPGVVALNQGALKATPFKLNKKAVDEASKKKIARYECEIDLAGMGSHIIDCFVSSEFELSASTFGYEVDAEQDGTIERKFSQITDHHSSCLIDTDEECYYEFSTTNKETGLVTPYRMYISADDSKQDGAQSEFERLVIMNRASASGGHESPRVASLTCRLAELEIWAQDDPNSFRPLILGPDYMSSWKKPSWDFDPPFSSVGLPIDPRPKLDEFSAPKAFLDARTSVIKFVNNLKEQEHKQPVEAWKLSELSRDKDFILLVENLLDAYSEWLDTDYDNAAWSDVICVHSSQSNSKALESTPYAILMSPLHPIKLAWHCCAQSVLQEALDKHSRCPAASIMNPAMFPDCFVLPCKTATGSIDRKGFVSLASSSDYWGVLFSVESSDLHELTDGTSIFDSDLGLTVKGLASGFSSQQVIRSLDEISRLLSAKTSLRIGLSSDAGGSSSCNDGIYNWCSVNLGEDQDQWTAAGPKSLIIDDFRNRELQPEPAELASLTNKTSTTVSWFRVGKKPVNYKSDLSIIAHLSTMNRSFDEQKIRSAVDASSLVRWRIRKQLPNQNTAFIAESRIGDIPLEVRPESTTSKLLKCVDRLEVQCSNTFDSYIFAPDLEYLSSVVGHSSYTVLSSEDIDAACFFGSTSKAYLWDYELPSYSKRTGENTGYYLLATESNGVLTAVRSALSLLGDGSGFSDDNISSLLAEISRRGMPTLKRLTSGGTMSVGELGMLVALRIFQSDFEEECNAPALLPSKSGDTLNLIIPADPFQSHYDDLRTALDFKNSERPDLLVFSVVIIDGKPIKMRLTPVEVKARKDCLSASGRKDALGQAKNFAELLQGIQDKAKDVELWGIAWRNLLATMLDYGFRVYGQLGKFMDQADWAKQHSVILKSIALGELEIEIDKRGRLIVVENSNDLSIHDLDKDGLEETIVIQHAEALSILSSRDKLITNNINRRLKNWDLIPSLDNEPPETPEPKISPESPVTSVYPVINESLTTIGNGIKFTVGKTIKQFTEEQLSFFPSNTALNQLNVGIVGDLGTGKTQLTQALIYQLTQDASSNRGKKPNMLIFDYKRDYSKPDFVKATGAKVVSPFDIPLNLFDIRDSQLGRRAWLERSKFFIDLMNKLYSGIGAVQGQNIKEAVKAAYEKCNENQHGAPTIYDVFEEYKAVVKNPDIPYSIMSDLVDGEYFVANNAEVVPFSEFLNGIVVIDLSQVGQDDKTKNMLVVIFLNLFYEHMLRIEKRPFVGDEPQLRFVDTMLLVDEADNIMKYEFEVLKKILLQGREFGVGVLLASQYLSHFKTSHENYLEPLLTWFVHKVPNVTVKELEGIGMTRVNPDVVEQIKTLNCHECLYKTFDVPGKIIRGMPFFELDKN